MVAAPQAKLPSHCLAIAVAAEAPEPTLHLLAVATIVGDQVATVVLQIGTVARMGVARHS